MNPTTIVLERYEETLLGLPYSVTLHNIAEQIVIGGGFAIAVPNSEYLAQLVAASLCVLPTRLTSHEYRFFRRVVGKTTEDFAKLLSIRPDRLRDLETFDVDSAFIIEGFDTYIRLVIGSLLKSMPLELPPLSHILLIQQQARGDENPKIEIYYLGRIPEPSENNVILPSYGIYQVTCQIGDTSHTRMYRSLIPTPTV